MGDREVDQQLVVRAQQGDKRAYELLVLKYQRKLARLLSRLVRDPAEVEDVTQEAFIKAYRALPSFRGESAFYTWLYRIGINTAKNYLVAMGRSEERRVGKECPSLCRSLWSPDHLKKKKFLGLVRIVSVIESVNVDSC